MANPPLKKVTCYTCNISQTDRGQTDCIHVTALGSHPLARTPLPRAQSVVKHSAPSPKKVPVMSKVAVVSPSPSSDLMGSAMAFFDRLPTRT